MLEIEIDGQQVQVPDGSTVMDAAAQVGAYIPHFCYHKKLSIAANCRMCLVQVEKAPKPLPACATPVTNGMKVWTHSDAAVTAQKGVMEFLLINHPLDCPICDQGGECQLQDLAVGYGGSQSRYQEEKRVVLNKNLGALISTDMTRCINCTRCVRFTTEIAGEMELGQAFRGEHAEIMPFVEKTVDSELSGNIIDLCPVGALTSKPFRFAARTWELSRRRSVSPHDSLGSNLIVQTKHDKVLRVLPLENEEINECWLSDKDRFSYEGLASSERLTAPMIRQGTEWKTVDWQTALEFCVTELGAVVKDQGAEALGALLSPHSTFEELYLAQKLVRSVGSDNVDFRLRQWDFRADGKRKGAPWLGMPIVDVGKLDRLLVVGSFLRKDAPLLAQRVRQAAKRGLHVNSVSPCAENWLIPVKNRVLVSPAAMVNMLGQIVVALARTKNIPVSPALETGLPELISEQAEIIAVNLAQGEKVAVWLGSLAVQHAQAAELEVLAQEIARLTGGVAGCIGEAANSVGGYLAQAVPQAGGLNARSMVEKPRSAYFVLGAEPDLDFAYPEATLTALSSARVVVALSAFDSPALRMTASVLLPIAPFTETSGTFVNCEGRAQSFTAVARPVGEARPGWKVLRVLGNLLQLQGFDYESSEEVRTEGIPEDIFSSLNNQIEGVGVTHSVASTQLERVTNIPIYAADPLVRRAVALSRTKDAAAPVARVSAATLNSIGVNSGDVVRFSQGGGTKIELTVILDDQIADGCVGIPAAHPLTAALGPISGELGMERI